MRESETRLEVLRGMWPAPERRTYADEVELARGRYGLEASDVLILKAWSFGLGVAEAALVTGFSEYTINDRWPRIMRALRAKNPAQAVCNALRAGLIS